MKTIQLSYPYPNLQLDDVSILQIGIENPHNFPLEHLVEHEKPFQPVVYITEGGSEKGYTITDREILEFSEMYFSSIGIRVANVSNPYTIIDVSYE